MLTILIVSIFPHLVMRMLVPTGSNAECKAAADRMDMEAAEPGLYRYTTDCKETKGT
jgi:hypothetical protein